MHSDFSVDGFVRHVCGASGFALEFFAEPEYLFTPNEHRPHARYSVEAWFRRARVRQS